MNDEKEDKTIVTNIIQPELVNIPLFLHQLKSIEDMENLENEKEIALNTTIYINTKLGVLADLPGYGKSLSVLGLISRSRDKNKSDEPIAIEKIKYHDYVSVVKTEIINRVNCSVILVNVSLMSQWVFELNRTLLNYIAIHKISDIEDIEISKYDVVLVSSNVYNVFCQVYKKKYWTRFIIDEPSSLKMSMDEIHADFYWLITGTPNELYLKRITGFLNDLLPEDNDTFNHLIVKNDDEVVMSSYDMPVSRNIYYKCKGCISSLFEGIVPDNVLEMIQALNIGGVYNAFNIDDATNISIYDAYKIKKQKRLDELNNEKMKKIERIEMIENHINLMDERIARYVIENNCIICNHEYKDVYVLSCCQQIYCGCLNNLNDYCPLCKSRDFINIKMATKNIMSSRLEKSRDTTELKNKMEKMLDIIGDSINKKILIFSNYNETFNVIKKFLEERKLIYLELRGTKEKRDNTIDSYKCGNVNILLLNTIQSGAGLNLQETSDIILFHKIHDYQKIQVIGRANRIGRKIELNVHYLE
jgi:SNF2 family DNA or RNA helicase